MDGFLLDVREALSIWLALLGVIGAAFGLMSIIARRGKPRTPGKRVSIVDERAASRRASAAEPRPVTGATRVQELARYAEEIAVVAERAAETARRRRIEWVSAQRTQEATWRAYETVESAARRVDLAAAFPAPREEPTAADLVARQRHLRQVAIDAHARGELSADQLADALAHRNGWDPRRHPIELETMLRHITRDRLLRAYQEAAVIERATWHAAELAAAAKRSLDDEAFAAQLAVRRERDGLAVSGAERGRATLFAGGARVATS